MTRTRDVLPREDHAGRAKRERLQELRAAGLGFLRAYGNAPTDSTPTRTSTSTAGRRVPWPWARASRFFLDPELGA